MKLTAAELKRLMELMGKSASSLTDAEKNELTTLQAKANASADEEGLGADEVKTLVENAVKSALEKGATAGVNEAQVKSIVETAVKGIKVDANVDQAAIVTQVTESVKKLIPQSLSADDVKGIVTNALKNTRTAPKMVHEAEDVHIELPIAHRAGNLSVAQKQLLNVMRKKDINAEIPDTILQDAERRSEVAEKRMYARGAKAITTSGAGTGAEFMNVTLSSTLLQRMYMESKLAAAMIAQEIQMPSDPFNFPLATTRPTFRTGVAQNTAPGASDPGSDKLTLNSSKLIGMTQYSDEAEEDAIIAILPLLTSQLAAAAADSLEDAIINGDTAGTQDTGTASDSPVKLFDGIRKLTLAAGLKLSLASGGISTANVSALRKLLGRWGLDPSQLLLVAGVLGYNDFVLLPETLTAEKAGSAGTARALTGQAPNILGIDIVPSARIREDLNASGVYDGTTTTKGSLLLIHKPSWIQGVRRGFTLETWRDARAQTNYVIASFRRAFKPLESLANTKAAALGYNYTA
jgi:hypothetical protein